MLTGYSTAFPCIIPTIAAFQDEHITVMATINAAGAFDNVAGALAEEEDPNYINNFDNMGGTADPAPIVPPVPGSSKPIPTLSEWALILMSGLLGLAVFARQRKLL